MDIGHLVILVLLAVFGWWLYKHPSWPADPTGRKVAWFIWGLFAVVWLLSVLGYLANLL